MSRRRQRVGAVRRPPCPTPAKWAHTTEQEAEGQARDLRQAHRVKVRCYRCCCGWWHVTTWTPSQYAEQQRRDAELEAAGYERLTERTDR